MGWNVKTIKIVRTYPVVLFYFLTVEFNSNEQYAHDTFQYSLMWHRKCIASVSWVDCALDNLKN